MNEETEYILKTPTKRRFISKDGKRAIRKINRYEKSFIFYYMADLVSALLECRWRYLLMWFSALNIVSWYIFGVLWWIIAYAHDDLLTSPHYDPNRVPCVSEVKNMINAFMFSMETHYTTGYGSRTPNTVCPEAIFLLCVQNIVSMLAQSSSLGIIYAKLTRPKIRSQAIKFSRKAVIYVRDGYLCLAFRIADVRKSQVIRCEVKAWILQDYVTSEGEFLARHRSRLTLSVDNGGNDPFLAWPVTVIHKIDESSPLYDVSPQKLSESDIEIVVMLSCTIESTGQEVEVCHSYTPEDVFWGHRFRHMIQRDADGVFVNYSLFDKTRQVDTAICSARSLYQYRYSSRINNSFYIKHADIKVSKVPKFPPIEDVSGLDQSSIADYEYLS